MATDLHPCVASVYAKRPEGEDAVLEHLPLFFFAGTDDEALALINEARRTNYPEPLWESRADWGDVEPRSYQELQDACSLCRHCGEKFAVFAASVLGRRWEDDKLIVEGTGDIFMVYGAYDQDRLEEISQEIAEEHFPGENGWQSSVILSSLDPDLFLPTS